MTARDLPPLSALRAFEAAARHRSAKRAADELSVTPTAISHQLRSLEDWLAVPLFIRKPRQLELTAAGRELLGEIGSAFDVMTGAVARLRAVSRRRHVTLSTTPAVASRWLLPHVGRLREQHPELDLHIHVTHEPVPLDGHSADIAIRYGSGRWPGLVAHKLFDNHFVPACSPALKLKRAQDLPRHGLLHFLSCHARSAPIGWAEWQKLAQVRGLDPCVGPVFSDETHTVSAALAGQGVALMSRALIADELRQGSLVCPFGPELVGEPFHLVYPEAQRNHAAIGAVRQWVLQLLPLLPA
ncbi:LysR substrate-binding domain-containing protein [Polaromonas sp.]|uniref:LysR substrate-binding domain-containing protein n=1 Tax=Polaromonas sp. TaxID=1869339 RepID=UPI002487475C|nr:LysR substrate-binding domain-containing protein [Polaromonas sp.]MDI1273278.1 LysR substrate-binding domain-containing protein [Polaromonas sp.]